MTPALICADCGYTMETAGPLTAEDGTELTVAQYLNLLALTDSRLLCSVCAEGVEEGDVVGRLS